MHIRFVTPNFPPCVCGIADHCYSLARELARTQRVDVLTGDGGEPAPDGMPVRRAFDTHTPESLSRVVDACRDRPDWVLWQYDPFAFGTRYGINFRIPWVMAELRRRVPETRQAVLLHESFLPGNSLSRWALRATLGAQLGLMCLSADLLFVVVERWARGLRHWFPDRPIRHLPVGSNVPRIPMDPEEARTRLGIPPDTFVVGLFGRLGRTRALEPISNLFVQLERSGLNPLLFYVGLESASARKVFPSLPLRAEGPLGGEEVSLRLSAMDVYLVPIDEGVTTRRTSLMAGLQHGLPVVATSGRITDSILRAADGRALLLAPAGDPDALTRRVLAATDLAVRQALGRAGRELYLQEFDWPVLAARVLADLNTTGRTGSRSFPRVLRPGPLLP